MPKKYFCTSVKFIVFKQQMLQAANTDLFYPKLTIVSVKIKYFFDELNH